MTSYCSGKCCLYGDNWQKPFKMEHMRTYNTKKNTSKTLFSVQNCNLGDQVNWIITRNSNQNFLTSSRYKEMITLKEHKPSPSAKRRAFCFAISRKAFSKVCSACIHHPLMWADRGICKFKAFNLTSLQSFLRQSNFHDWVSSLQSDPFMSEHWLQIPALELPELLS